VKAFLAGVKRWYLRRFKGIVKPPAHAKGHGTTWQQHQEHKWVFRCRCGEQHVFGSRDFFVRSREHKENCATQGVAGDCTCPITDARYVWKCPKCGIGHWKDATGETR